MEKTCSTKLDWSVCTCLTHSCVRQVHTLQSSLIVNTTGMMNLMTCSTNE